MRRSPFRNRERRRYLSINSQGHLRDWTIPCGILQRQLTDVWQITEVVNSAGVPPPAESLTKRGFCLFVPPLRPLRRGGVIGMNGVLVVTDGEKGATVRCNSANLTTSSQNRRRRGTRPPDRLPAPHSLPIRDLNRSLKSMTVPSHAPPDRETALPIAP